MRLSWSNFVIGAAVCALVCVLLAQAASQSEPIVAFWLGQASIFVTIGLARLMARA